MQHYPSHRNTFLLMKNHILAVNTFHDKIDFFRKNYEKDKITISNSQIIDYYMSFMYSTLEYKIMPVMSVGDLLSTEVKDWKFGKNVEKTIKLFFQRYNAKFLKITGYEDFTESNKKIINVLREYGIVIKDSILNQEMLFEIENKLNKRYSTYDIIIAIHKLCQESTNNRYRFIQIRDNYLV